MPSALSASQIARPMPRVPPVTMATRAISSPLLLFWPDYARLGSPVPHATKNPAEAGLLAQVGFLLEPELRPDVDRLVVLLGGVGHRRQPVAFGLIAHAGGDI